MLDPIRLFRQVERLQQAVFRCAVSAAPLSHHPPVTPLLVFSLEACTGGSFPAGESLPKSESHHAEPARRCADLVCAPSACQMGVSAPICASMRSSRHDLASNAKTDRTIVSPLSRCKREQGQVVQAPKGFHAPAEAAHHARLSGGDQSQTIEEAIQQYLQQHQRAKHQPKTVAWHQTALGHFHRYLRVERHLLLVSRLSEADVRGWFCFLQETPGASGKERSTHTIATYIRSVRAFCAWLVRRRWDHRAGSACAPIWSSIVPHRRSLPCGEGPTKTISSSLRAAVA